MPFVSAKTAVLAAPQLQGPDVDTVISARQKEIELQEAELERKESDLRLSCASLAPSVQEARWACMREVGSAQPRCYFCTHSKPRTAVRHCRRRLVVQERHALAQKWACLAQDKRLRADREQMMLSGGCYGVCNCGVEGCGCGSGSGAWLQAQEEEVAAPAGTAFRSAGNLRPCSYSSS